MAAAAVGYSPKSPETCCCSTESGARRKPWFHGASTASSVAQSAGRSTVSLPTVTSVYADASGSVQPGSSARERVRRSAHPSRQVGPAGHACLAGCRPRPACSV